MLKLIIFVILCGGLQLSCGEKLKCEFKDEGYSVGTLYSCYVTSLDNSFNNIIIDGYTGVHKTSKNDKDVKGIWIHRTNTKYIPDGLGSLSNLLGLAITSSQLVEIRSKDFQGMQNLEYLNLRDNQLTSVPLDTFIMLPKLKVIYLHSNQIKYIGSGVFDQLTNLNKVNLVGNICVNKDYNGATAITQMKEDLKANCQNINDVIQYEIKHKIRDESSRIRKESQEQFKALNEIVKQLLLEAKEYKMEHQEIIKLRAELLTAKDGQKKEQESNIKVTNERDQMKKENADLKETIQQKLPKMEQTIEEFHMEVMDLKIERHHQREMSIGLRSKLLEAKEQLADCQINERISC